MSALACLFLAVTELLQKSFPATSFELGGHSIPLSPEEITESGVHGPAQNIKQRRTNEASPYDNTERDPRTTAIVPICFVESVAQILMWMIKIIVVPSSARFVGQNFIGLADLQKTLVRI